MAVSQSTIKADLKQLYDDAKAAEMDDDTFANRMATIIADAILTADVDPGGGPPPLTAPSGGGPVTGKGKLL